MVEGVVQDRRQFAIALTLVSYLLFTLIDTCAKWLTLRGMPTGQVVFVRYAGQFILVLALFAPRYGIQMLRTQRPGLEVLRGLALLGSTAGNFVALAYLPLTVTASIAFTVPLILSALSVPLLGEKVGWRRWLAILVGFCGVLIIIRPGTEAFQPVSLFSLAAAASVSIYMILTRKLAGIDPPETQQFYAGTVATVCLLPFALADWMWPVDPIDWLAFCMIGAVALIGHQILSFAHHFAPASVLAPFGYVQIFYMSASSWLIFNQPPDSWIFVGAPVVMASGLYIWLRERQLSRHVVTGVTVRD